MHDQQKARTEAQKKAERRASRPMRAVTLSDARPYATYGIILATAIVYLLQLLIPGRFVEGWLAFNSLFVVPGSEAAFQPWRLITVLFVHGSFWHIALNMLALWMIGRSLEPLLGHGRFLTLYFLSGLGGSVAVALLAPGVWVVGASGAIFGLFGALLVIGRHIGANITSIAIIIGINLVIGFVPGFNVSWQAHVGGLLVGLLVSFIYTRTRSPRQRGLQIALLAAVAAVLIALLLVPIVAPALILG